MRPIILLIISLSLYLPSLASDSLFTQVFQENMEQDLSLGDSLTYFIDYNNEYSIERILQSESVVFELLDLEQPYQFPITIWSKIQFVNQSQEELFQYFLFCNRADSVLVYTVENNQRINSYLSGNDVVPAEKDLLSEFNLVPIRINTGGEKTYYTKVRFNESIDASHFSELFIKSGQKQVHRVLKRFALQSFFAGILILFCIVSIFMFFIFHEKVFIFFGLMMVSFAAYFLARNNVIDSLFSEGHWMNIDAFIQVTISGFIIFLFLFINDYVQLSKLYPKFYRLYFALSIFVCSYSHFFRILGKNQRWIVETHNILILIWILVTIVPIVLLTIRGNKAAKTLLISIGVLFLASIVFILGSYRIIPFGIIVEYGLQIGVILFSGILFYGLFNKITTIRAEKQRFEELDHLKSRFFANISHEFRTPLTLILGPIKQLISKQEDNRDRQLLETAHRNGSRLLNLINQLLDLSKIEVGKMKLETNEVNFTALLKGIVMSFESLAKRKNITLHFVSQNPQLKLHIDVDKVEKIFYNLLSNAFKFTEEQGEVSVMITEQNDGVEILVRDNGVGIPNTRLSNIFNRFYQVDSSTTREQEGTGIGLALVKELVELHHGTISVESEENKGTTFKILLSKGTAHLQHDEIRTELKVRNESVISTLLFDTSIDRKTSLPSVMQPLDLASNDKPLLLIIEDNDDVRNYIKQYLDDSFNVIEATNGQEGIDKALEHLPDIIISDVMMPKKSGYEVCEALKTDQRTSHIPLILLTAKAEQAEKLKGLETGADDYLLKPFDTKELEVRVRNLIKIRTNLRKRFSESNTFELTSLAINSTDQIFWKKVKDTVETNINNEQFSVEVLAKEVGMSRVHLNRKLKALTDQSANKFIQAYRLQQSFLLLKNKAGNVSEIAFQVGFSSTAYFVKCFREKYGKTPGAVLQDM